MLTALTLCSVPFFVVMWILSVAPSPRQFLLARPLPRLRPTLGAWAAIIVILAVDFAAATTWGPHPGVAARVCLCDGAVILAVMVALVTAQRSILDLWGVALNVGMLAFFVVVATTPAVAMR